MADFPELPTEIWLLIARHIHGPHLAKLKALNSCFFHCYMDMRWKRVEIDTRFASKVAFNLERLADPFVASRTKLLTICVRDSSKLGATDLLTSLPILPHVNALKFTQGDNSDATARYAAALFQTITSSSMARTLQALRLTVYADFFRPLEYAPNTMEKLTVLFLDLNMDCRTLKFLTACSSFVRTLAPTLQQLRISDRSERYDLSPVFDTLSIPFPHLNSLILVFCLHDSDIFQPSHRSLLRFLAHHNNLHYLHLILRVSRFNKNYLGAWLTELVNNTEFSSLKTLGIYPSNTPAGLCAVLALIKRTAHTLTSLVIYDHRLTYGDVVRVLDALTESDIHDPTTEIMARTENPAGNLKSLEMCIIELSVPLLDLLACRLPHLEKLSLWALRVVGSDQHSFYDLMDRRRYNPNIAHTQLEDAFHMWKLQNLSILKKTSRYSSPDKDAERVVVGAVPALTRKV